MLLKYFKKDPYKRKEKFGDVQTESLIKGKNRFDSLRKIGRLLFTVTVSAFLGFHGCSKKEEPPPIIQNMPIGATYIKTADKFVTLELEGLSPTKVADRQILVTFDEEATSYQTQDVEGWLVARGAKHVGQIPDMKTVQYELKEGDDLAEVLKALEDKEGVWVASPNIVLTPLLDPNPNVVGDAVNGFYWADKINLREAWDITTGSTETPIAILDDGIKIESGHFNGKDIRIGIRCLREDGTIYYDSDIKPIEDCTALEPVSGGHGTAVAGIAGARGDDGVSGFGVAWKNPLISIDITSTEGETPIANTDAATELAIRMGAKVINISYSACHNDECTGQVTQSDRTYFRSNFLPAMRLAYAKDVLVVFGAGNDAFKHDDKWLPDDQRLSEYNYADNAILVGATDDWDDPMCITDWVKFGLPCESRRYLNRCECASCNDISTLGHYFTVEGAVVELSAPGYRIAVPDAERTDGSLFMGSGTSVSAPMVAGAAALILSEHPDFRPVKVKDILLKSARKGDGCRDIGEGILDVAAALELANKPNCYKLADIENSASKADVYGNTVVWNDGGTLIYYANAQTGEIKNISPTEECNAIGAWPHIWGDKIVTNCVGSTCDGVCLYKIGEETIELLDEGQWPDINGDKVAYIAKTLDNKWALKMYNLASQEIQEAPLPENLEVYDLVSTLLYGSKVTVLLRDRQSEEWQPELYLYDFDSGELRLIKSYAENEDIGWSIYGDKIVYSTSEGVVAYDIPSDSISLLTENFASATQPDLWKDNMAFYGEHDGKEGLFVIDISTNEVNLFTEKMPDYTPSTPALSDNVMAYLWGGSATLAVNVCILPGT